MFVHDGTPEAPDSHLSETIGIDSCLDCLRTARYKPEPWEITPASLDERLGEMEHTCACLLEGGLERSTAHVSYISQAPEMDDGATWEAIAAKCIMEEMLEVLGMPRIELIALGSNSCIVIARNGHNALRAVAFQQPLQL